MNSPVCDLAAVGAGVDVTGGGAMTGGVAAAGGGAVAPAPSLTVIVGVVPTVSWWSRAVGVGDELTGAATTGAGVGTPRPLPAAVS
jgi:hypothetical protein